MTRHTRRRKGKRCPECGSVAALFKFPGRAHDACRACTKRAVAAQFWAEVKAREAERVKVAT